MPVVPPAAGILPDYSVERALLESGAREVAGVDEAGRGPLAGPVTAAAVVLDAKALPSGIDDSKKLGTKARERALEGIMACARVSVAHATVEEIDRLNILHASLLAMKRAVAGLRGMPCHVLVDGNMVPGSLGCEATAMVKGDSRSLSIAAASILAKVTRDRIMEDLARKFPGYGWERNAGYPTKAHREALAKLGVTPHHRRSFKTVRELL
ncbi:MAG: ribonuclease HII [Boseongicola sp. SB0664_bin_43]|uniref:Ribonuclease HII n=1 Tax=Boseongicola sp. SB0664_bin_43 TaxID=2604844 RepID=A0A6B0XYK3_9RHOB|nr:ribonuclease HII [Boseongicola sp. SB0664_bin_43]MYK33243.1 ribonuclease HII [Boseongicola sp. SB0670_bin_30]